LELNQHVRNDLRRKITLCSRPSLTCWMMKEREKSNPKNRRDPKSQGGQVSRQPIRRSDICGVIPNTGAMRCMFLSPAKGIYAYVCGYERD
jgi:hypothetical protein